MEGGGAAKAWAAMFAFLYLITYLLYIGKGLNSPEPTVLGLSRTLAFSLLVWLGLMALIVIAYKSVWR